MKIKKTFVFIILLFLILTINFPCFADDIDYEDTTDISSVINVSSDLSKIPNINSRSAIIYDRTSGNIIYGKSENEKKKMASTTKIMTAIIVLENSNLTDTVIISKKSASIGGSRLGLKTNDKITVHDLLYGLMLCSGNDAAIALAEYIGNNLDSFANMMNEKVSELGLKNTHFVTPHGLDNDEHYTTAYELAKLTDYSLKNEMFKKIVSTKNYTITINGFPKNINNTNELLGVLDGVYGVKTGFTNGANRCLVTSIKRKDFDIICIVLGADTKKMRTQDSIKLINYTYTNFEMVDINSIIQSEFESWKKNNLSKFTIIKGDSNNFDITLSNIETKKIPIKKENIKDLSINIECSYIINSPIYKNTPIGNLSLSIKDNILLNLNLVSNCNINKKSILDYFSSFFTSLPYNLETIILE